MPDPVPVVLLARLALDRPEQETALRGLDAKPVLGLGSWRLDCRHSGGVVAGAAIPLSESRAT
jgi:hypothetical protein